MNTFPMKIRDGRTLAFCICAALLVALGCVADERTNEDELSKLLYGAHQASLAAYEEIVRQGVPNDKAYCARMIVIDDGNRWLVEVSFGKPGTLSAGGGYLVFIDKVSFKVLGTKRTN